MADKRILAGITTTAPDWRDKAAEVRALGLEEIALFPTAIGIDERRELYELLEETSLKRIPHVHLRDDMQEWEIRYLEERFETGVFNTHADRRHRHFLAIGPPRPRIYIENLRLIDRNFREVMDKFSGICIDFAHWEDFGQRLQAPGYEDFARLTKERDVGCCHVSAIADKPVPQYYAPLKREFMISNSHYLAKLSDLDYMERYRDYLPGLISLELENPISVQLQAKAYLEKLLDL